jgi:hypothetical protein
VKICFVVVSDGTWDDEDGSYSTCDGAFTVDNIHINSRRSSNYVHTDFETGTLEGWEVCGGSSPGDYVAIRDRGCFVNNLPCGFDCCDMEGCVLTFYNPDIAGAYGNGGHRSGDFHKRAWSPAVDMTPYPPRGYSIKAIVYGDLPILNMIFMRYWAKYVQSPNCPAGAWSYPISDNNTYYFPGPQCYEVDCDLSGYIPADAESVKIGISVWPGCELYGYPCTNGNETPIIDNVRLAIWEL